VVRSLIASKKRRQLVVVTHNPNLVVNGDAELVVSMDIPAGEVKIQAQEGYRRPDP
jgi:DNA repair ATPase RecN